MTPESFKNPTPESTGQFEELGIDRIASLISEAKDKFEGVVLYAPIPEEVRKELLTRISDVPADDSEGLRSAFRERDLAPEQQASLWVDRWIRSAVQASRTKMDDRDHEMLQLALNKLYAPYPEHFDGMVAAWMDSGRKPPATNH